MEFSGQQLEKKSAGRHTVAVRIGANSEGADGGRLFGYGEVPGDIFGNFAGNQFYRALMRFSAGRVAQNRQRSRADGASDVQLSFGIRRQFDFRVGNESPDSPPVFCRGTVDGSDRAVSANLQRDALIDVLSLIHISEPTRP